MNPWHRWRMLVLASLLLPLAGCYNGISRVDGVSEVRLHYRSQPAGADFYTGQDDVDGQFDGTLVGRISWYEWNQGVHCLDFATVNALWISGARVQVTPRQVCLDHFTGGVDDRYVVVIRPAEAPNLQLDEDYAADYLRTHNEDASPVPGMGQDTVPVWTGGTVYLHTDDGHDHDDRWQDRDRRRRHHDDDDFRHDSHDSHDRRWGGDERSGRVVHSDDHAGSPHGRERKEQQHHRADQRPAHMAWHPPVKRQPRPVAPPPERERRQAQHAPPKARVEQPRERPPASRPAHTARKLPKRKRKSDDSEPLRWRKQHAQRQ